MMVGEITQSFVVNKGKIIADIYSEDPDEYTRSYANAIVDTIKESDPHYSIGLYGEWGSGKTTLMRDIYNQLKAQDENKNIIPIWFNAWRYEHEEQFAIIPLLKTIAYAIPDDKEELKNLKEKIKKGGINILKRLPDIIPAIAGHYLGEHAKEGTSQIIDSFKREFIPKIELLSEIDKDTIYFDGLDQIEEEMKKIMVKYPKTRIVVFIDDLDRCKPKKALEIFESIKVFLDLIGFVYVIGLTNQSISRLITPEDYGYEGKEYIKKLIQIPINIPKWNTDRIFSLIIKHLGIKEISKIDVNLKEQLNLIAYAVKNNPRELVRFLNNIQLSSKIYKDKNLNLNKFLILETIITRWSDFYYNLMYLEKEEIEILDCKLKFLRDDKIDIGNLNQQLPDDIKGKLEIIRIKLDKIEVQSSIDQDIKIVINRIKEYRDLLTFIVKYYEQIFEIIHRERDTYEQVVEAINKSSIIINSEMEKEIALDFLKDEKIREFNKVRKMYEKIEIKLDGTDLSGLNLSGVNLRYSELTDSDLSDSKLSNSDIHNSNLKNCDFTDTDMSNSNLSYSDLTGAYMIRANLKKSYMLNTIINKTYLEDGNLEEVDLSGSESYESELENVNLAGADLRYTKFINTNLTNVKFTGANLDHVVIVIDPKEYPKFNINNVDFSDARLTNSLIIVPGDTFNFKYNQNTDFNGSIIDNPNFIDYIKITSNKARGIPRKIQNKEDLKKILKERRHEDEELIDEIIDKYLLSSTLAEEKTFP